jgi:tetratricopeptide (TPR) repeat protein
VETVSSWIAPRSLAGAALLLAGLALCVCHRRGGVRFSALFPFATLALTANIFFPIGTIKAERLLYLPSVGTALLAGYAFHCVWRKHRYRAVTAAVVATVIAAYAARTWTRNRDWASNATLFHSMARTAPRSAKAHYNRALVFYWQGAYPAAGAEFHHAFEIYPWHESAFGVAAVLEHEGRTDDAVHWYQRSLDLLPSFSKAHVNLCRILHAHRRYQEAAASCRTGLRFDPADANLLKGLGASLVEIGNFDNGIQILQRSLTLNPSDSDLRSYIGAMVRKPHDK